MDVRRGQWVRFDCFKLVEDDKGKYTGELASIHCYYRIMGISKAKGMFTVEYPDYVFSLDDGSVLYGDEKCPHVGSVSPLNIEDMIWLNEVLNESPQAIMIEANEGNPFYRLSRAGG